MNLPQRKLPRLRRFDYSSQNYYFITICTHDKQHLFGKPSELNTYGKMAQAACEHLAEHFDGVRVDHFVVMPNHIHMILILGLDGKTERSRPFPTISTVVGLLKSGISREIRKSNPDLSVWQKSFHDHIIRSEASYQKIWNYIESNPSMWHQDCYYS